MINTVLGKIYLDELGKTLIHEHLFCGLWDVYHSLGKRWFYKNGLDEHGYEDKLLVSRDSGTFIDFGVRTWESEGKNKKSSQIHAF